MLSSSISIIFFFFLCALSSAVPQPFYGKDFFESDSDVARREAFELATKERRHVNGDTTISDSDNDKVNAHTSSSTKLVVRNTTSIESSHPLARLHFSGFCSNQIDVDQCTLDPVKFGEKQICPGGTRSTFGANGDTKWHFPCHNAHYAGKISLSNNGYAIHADLGVVTKYNEVFFVDHTFLTKNDHDVEECGPHLFCTYFYFSLDLCRKSTEPHWHKCKS